MPAVKDEASHFARLLIVDDHDLVREGIRAMLEKEPDLQVVGEATDGQEALKLCDSLNPDLVLMDVRMPRMDGLKATQEIKEQHPTTSILIVTTHESPDYLLEAIRAGAAGYVLKDATKKQLLGAVRRVLDGESPLNQELAMQLLQRIAENYKHQEPLPRVANHHSEAPPPKPPAKPLTDRELKVLQLLVQGKTNREAAEELRVSLSTIKNHVHHIIDKLGVSDRTQAAVRAVELGLLGEQAEE
jgi:DNA-binding NarL/FixJ family response regulator